MKVTYLVDVFPNLTETFVLNQITGLIERGFDVEILAMAAGSTEVVHADIVKYDLLQKTHYLFDKKLGTNRFLRMLFMFVRLCRYSYKSLVWRALFCSGSFSLQMRIYLACAVAKTPYTQQKSITIAHFGPTAVFAYRLKKLGLLTGPILPVFHGFDLSEKKVLNIHKQAYQQLFADCPLILTISKHWAEKLIELGCNPNKVVLNRMGINCDVFEMRTTEEPLIPPIKLLTVARLTEKKGIIYAIEAVAKLKAQGFDVQLDIIGTGPLYGHLADSIRKYQLQDNVHLLGAKNQTEVRRQLQNSDLFLLHSVVAENGDKEGIPVSLMEAMASGILCLSTYHSGIPELITHGKNGLLVQERDVEALCQQIIGIIKGQFNMNELRREARQTVSQEFNQQKIYDDLAEICKEIGEDFV